MSVTGLQPSINYIPEELQAEDLYQTATVLIDAVRQREPVNIVLPLTPLIEELIPVYNSANSVLAYYNMFINTCVGTLTSLNLVLQLLNIQATVLEWFATPWNLVPYHFELTFAEFPNTLDLDLLIDLILAFKNERSQLVTIRMADGFQDVLTLDNSTLDGELLDDSRIDGFTGVLYRGIWIYLIRSRDEAIAAASVLGIDQLVSTTQSEALQVPSESEWPLDNFNLDTNGPYLGGIEPSHTTQ